MQKIKDWRNYLKSKREGTVNSLSREQEYFLILQKDTKLREKAIDELILVYGNIIHKIIKNYKWCNISYEDLYSYGIEGFVCAYDNFDISKGNRFSTYLFHYVLGRIKRALELYNNTIRKPALINMALTKISHLEDGVQYSDEYLETLSTKRITLQAIKNSLPYKNQKVISIDDITFDVLSGVDFNNVIEKEYLESLLGHLTLKESEILRMKFGISPYVPHTFKELDQHWNCDTELVFRRSIAKLREILGVKYE